MKEKLRKFTYNYLDFKKDLEVMKNVLKLTNERTDFGLKEIIDLFNKKKKIFKNNKHLEKKYLKNFSEEKKKLGK